MLRNPHSPAYLKKSPLFSPSRLPQSVHILKFRFHMACVRNINNGPFRGSAWPPVVAVSPSSPPGNSFSSSQFELFEMDLSGVEVELPAMRESRCWEGWIPLRCREQKHSLSSEVSWKSSAVCMLSSYLHRGLGGTV